MSVVSEVKETAMCTTGLMSSRKCEIVIVKCLILIALFNSAYPSLLPPSFNFASFRQYENQSHAAIHNDITSYYMMHKWNDNNQSDLKGHTAKETIGQTVK